MYPEEWPAENGIIPGGSLTPKCQNHIGCPFPYSPEDSASRRFPTKDEIEQNEQNDAGQDLPIHMGFLTGQYHILGRPIPDGDLSHDWSENDSSR